MGVSVHSSIAMRVFGALVSVLHLHAVQSKSKSKDDTSFGKPIFERECTELEISSKARKLEDGRMFKTCVPIYATGTLPFFWCQKDDDCQASLKKFKDTGGGGLIYKLWCKKAEENNYQGLKDLTIKVLKKGKRPEEMPKEWKSKFNKLLEGSQNICDGLTQCQTYTVPGLDEGRGLCIEPITCECDKDCSEINLEGTMMKRKCVPYKESARCEIILGRPELAGQFVE